MLYVPEDEDDGPNATAAQLAQMSVTNVSSPAATASAISVQSGNYNVGGNLTIQTIVKSSQVEAQSPVSKWLAELASVNQYAIQKETCEKVAPGTCSWILEEPKFDAWISGRMGTFWGVGMPGAGKTILSSFVINHLQRHASNSEVLFTYCRYNDNLSVSRVLAGLLQQLVDSSEAVECYVQNNVFASCSKYETKPTQSELKSALQTSLELTSGVYVVVDALDELVDDIREEIVEILLSLGQQVFATSREIHLGGMPQPDIIIQAPKRDFKVFITREIERLPKLRSLLKNKKDVLSDIVDQIESKSDGMFLLSALQVAALGSLTTIKSLRRAIQDLPTSLKDMYESTLARINAQSEEERSLAFRAILWVTYAARPLMIAELLEALAVTPESAEREPEELTDERTLISVCCGLLTANNETGVRLAHYTTHNFFTAYQEEPFDDPHTFLATICAVYRGLSGIDSDVRGLDKFIDEFSLQKLAQNKFPFLEYAFRNLGYHTYHSALRNGGKVPSHVSHFLSAQTRLIVLSIELFPNVVDGTFHDFEHCHAAHFAALHGLRHWFEENMGPTVLNEPSQSLRTPLSYASAGGQTAIVEYLLETSHVNINARDHMNNTALDLAIWNGHMQVIECLLNRGASVLDSKALVTATRCGRGQVVQLLLRHPDIQNNLDTTLNRGVLHVAVESGHINIVRLLAACPGIDLNRRFDGLTPLRVAIASLRTHIANFLLSIPSVDYKGEGCRPNSSNTLHYAAIAGLDEVVNVLLGFDDIDVNAPDPRGRTALHLACYSRSVKSLRLLVESGRANINERNSRGWTPLHCAVDSRRKEYVEVLLEVPLSVDINATTERDYGGCNTVATALDIAISKGLTEIAVLLAEAGGRRAANL